MKSPWILVLNDAWNDGHIVTLRLRNGAEFRGNVEKRLPEDAETVTLQDYSGIPARRPGPSTVLLEEIASVLETGR